MPVDRQNQSYQPTVSVLIPSFNHSAFIAETICSVLAQTFSLAELIVIDDGSNDDSISVIESTLKGANIPCRLVARENRGLSATLNEGLSLANGDYFAYLGSDDLWLPHLLEHRVNALESRPNAVLAYGHCYLIDGEDRIVDCTADWTNYSDGDARPMLLKAIGLMSPTVVYRRRFLGESPWNPNAKLEDYDLYLRLCVLGDFAFDPAVLSAWRRHGHNTSHNQNMMLSEQIAALERNAVLLGLSKYDLNQLARSIKYSRAADFLRYGDKRTAARLMLSNWRGAGNLKASARMAVRFALPFSAMERRRKRLEAANFTRRGSIRDLLSSTGE